MTWNCRGPIVVDHVWHLALVTVDCCRDGSAKQTYNLTRVADSRTVFRLKVFCDTLASMDSMLADPTSVDTATETTRNIIVHFAAVLHKSSVKRKQRTTQPMNYTKITTDK
jgi:hypothetical protein